MMDNAISTGKYFMDKLAEVGKDHPEWVTNVRGRGLCLAYDVDFGAGTDTSMTKLMGELKKRGINVPSCGLNTIRARPCLYFKPEHVDIYVKNLRDAIAHLRTQ